MKLASDWSIPTGWQSILHIGNTDLQRLPKIKFAPNHNGLHVQQSYDDCSPNLCEWGVLTTGVTFAAGGSYEVKVVVESNQMTVYVDGIFVGTESGDATYAAANAAVYVGDPWYDAAAVTLSNICLKPILASTCGGCTDVAMNSEAYDEWVAEGTNRVPWTSVAGSPWFLRKTAFSQPDGNYDAGCWLTMAHGWDDGVGFHFDDNGCGNCFTNYLCSRKGGAKAQNGAEPTFTFTADDHAEVHFLDMSTQTLSATYVVGEERAAAEYVNGLPVVAKVERCGWEQPAWALRGVATFELGAAAVEVRALGDDEVLEAKYYHPPGGLENKFAEACGSLTKDLVVEGSALSPQERTIRGCRAIIPEVDVCDSSALVPNCQTPERPCATMDYTYVDELPKTRIFEVDLSVLCVLRLPGPVVASKGNQVATVDSLRNYELTFTMELKNEWRITGNWQSVLHIGNSDYQRLPGIWFHESQNALYVMQSYNCESGSPWGNNFCEWGLTTTGVTFAAGGTYEVKVVVESNQMTVYVNGVSVGKASGSATYSMTMAAVYVGNPWHDAAAATLSNICLKPIGTSSSNFGSNAVKFLIASPLCLESVSATAVTTLQSLLAHEGAREYNLAPQENLLMSPPSPDDEGPEPYGEACTDNTNAVFRERDAVGFGFELVEREPNCYGIYLYPWDSGCSGYIDTPPSPDHPIAIRVADGVSKTESSATYNGTFTHNMTVGVPNPFAPFSHELSVEFTRAFDAAKILFVRHALVLGVIPEEVPQVWTVATNPTLIYLILYDPPGGGSFATLTEGSAISTSMAIDGSHAAELANSMEVGVSVGGGLDMKTVMAPLGIGLETNIVDFGLSGGGSYSHSSPDVTVSRSSSRHFDVGISFSTGISTSSSPYLAGQPSDVIIGGGANLRFISAIEIYAKNTGTPSAPNLCLGGLTTNQFLPEQITTWVMSVYEIEKTLERLGAALTDPNTKITSKDPDEPDPRDDIAKQIENWQTVLTNYRAATIRDQAESVAEQLSRELDQFQTRFQGFLAEANDGNFKDFLVYGLNELGGTDYYATRGAVAGAVIGSAAGPLGAGIGAAVGAGVSSSLSGVGTALLKTYDSENQDRVNRATAAEKCVSAAKLADPSGDPRLCKVYQDIHKGLALRDKLLFGICDFQDENPSVEAFCKRDYYRPGKTREADKINAFDALYDTTHFITFSGTTGLEFSWDIAQSRGAELTSTHDAIVADAFGFSVGGGINVGRRLESSDDRVVPGYAYPVSGRVLAVSKKLLQVTPEALKRRRRLGRNAVNLGDGINLGEQLGAEEAEPDAESPDNPCRRRLDGVEMSDEERRRLGVTLCGGVEGGTSSSFAVSLGRAASKDAEHTRTVAIFLEDGQPQDVFAVKISQDAIYGTPIFTTMGGRSSCVGETGTTRRDSRVTIKEITPMCGGPGTRCENLPLGQDAFFIVVLQNLSPWKVDVKYILRAVNGPTTTWDSSKYTSEEYANTGKIECGPGDGGSLEVKALGTSGQTLRDGNGLMVSPLLYGQHEIRIRVTRLAFEPQCTSFTDIELELVALCEDTDAEEIQDVYQYQTFMNPDNGAVSVVHPKFVGRPVGDDACDSGVTLVKDSTDVPDTTYQGDGKWCYSDLNHAVGCTASPAACWTTCDAKVAELNGLASDDVSASCPAPFIKAVEPGKVKCDVGALKAIDWEEKTGQCRCQNSCQCTVEDLYSYDVTKNEGDPGYETRETTTHLLTKDGLEFPPKDKDGKTFICGLYTFTEASKARGPDTSKATFDVSWKNEVLGCTYDDAENYNALATEDDLSCVFALRGCPYPAAANYNPAATKNDGSCIFTMPRSLACDADLPERAYSSACRVSDGNFIRNYGVSNDEFWEGDPPTKGRCEAKDGITNWCPALPFVCSQPASCLQLDNDYGVLTHEGLSKTACLAKADDRFTVKWCPFETAVPTTAPTVSPQPTAVPTTAMPTVPPQPTAQPSSKPTAAPTTPQPSANPTPAPSTPMPSAAPTPAPTTPQPSSLPTAVPTLPRPTAVPTTPRPKCPAFVPLVHVITDELRNNQTQFSITPFWRAWRGGFDPCEDQASRCLLSPRQRRSHSLIDFHAGADAASADSATVEYKIFGDLTPFFMANRWPVNEIVDVGACGTGCNLGEVPLFKNYELSFKLAVDESEEFCPNPVPCDSKFRRPILSVTTGSTTEGQPELWFNKDGKLLVGHQQKIAASTALFEAGKTYDVTVTHIDSQLSISVDGNVGTDIVTKTWPDYSKVVSDAQAGSRWFGTSVAMVGDLLAVGSQNEMWPGSHRWGSGAAYLYRFDYSTASWIEEKKLIPSVISPDNNDEFGRSVALSENGNVLAVGAPRFYGEELGGHCCVGATFVYRYDETTQDWLEETRLRASYREVNDGAYGQSVALSDDFLLVGAYGEDAGADNTGAAYVYKHEGGSWVEKARLLAAGPPLKNKFFGAYVALSGTVAAVGATGEDDNRGAVYVFDLSGDPSSWSGTQVKIIRPDREVGDYFGCSVALSSDLLAVGVRGDDGFKGSAYVFRYDGSSWVQQAKFVASDAAPEDNYGFSVAVSDSVLAVGALYDKPTGDGGWANGAHGSVYYYHLSGSNPSEWNKAETKIAPTGAAAMDL